MDYGNEYKYRHLALYIWEENTYGKKKETDHVGALGQRYCVVLSPAISKGHRFKPQKKGTPCSASLDSFFFFISFFERFIYLFAREHEQEG